MLGEKKSFCEICPTLDKRLTWINQGLSIGSFSFFPEASSTDPWWAHLLTHFFENFSKRITVAPPTPTPGGYPHDYGKKLHFTFYHSDDFAFLLRPCTGNANEVYLALSREAIFKGRLRSVARNWMRGEKFDRKEIAFGGAMQSRALMEKFKSWWTSLLILISNQGYGR